MRILVTGQNGQLARSLLERSRHFPHLQITAAGRALVDLETPGSLAAAIKAVRPDLVINAAAYTAVDQAESEAPRAVQVNASAAGEASAAAAGVGAAIVQVSTDYVFDGRASVPYREDARTNPINVYGASKLAGEEAVRAANPRHLILRTSWVYSPFGRNFVKTMLSLAGKQTAVRVVADQYGCPTSALDLAGEILRLADVLEQGLEEGWGATFHLAGAGSSSWAEFAEEIFRISAAAGGPSAEVLPISTADYPTPAARPRYSVLDSGAWIERFGTGLPDWRASLKPIVQRIVAEAA